MYLCDNCGTAFYAPLRRHSFEKLDGHVRHDTEDLCPFCATPYFDPADRCPKCDDWKLTTDILCKSCRADLLRRFTAFADTLTAEEEEQLDDWTDGESITNRRKLR